MSRSRSAIWLVIAAIVSVQGGAAFAKSLFGQIDPTAMVWLRLAASALILVVIVRPRLAGRTRHDWLVAAAYAVTLVLMNWAIYQSFARIPLGLAVTIEFLGPLAVAVAMSRGWREVLLALLAGAGVVLLGFSPTQVDWVGVAYALLAGVGWAGYIVVGPWLGRAWKGLDGLAVASVMGTAALAVPAVLLGGSALVSRHILVAGAAVGLLSSVIPYSLELQALRTLPRRVFSILMSLEPAVAAGAALLLLGERLSVVDMVAMACVIAASVGVTGATAPKPD
ncbi:MAG TPA: EamA family transporter [Propionibacteriaceae bacterium]|nr:EamA family transporter [Propionibacteriaceae bacterium]HPZ49741.1 EamA family transporter [Propionibacteriaceae bacterium]